MIEDLNRVRNRIPTELAINEISVSDEEGLFLLNVLKTYSIQQRYNIDESTKTLDLLAKIERQTGLSSY